MEEYVYIYIEYSIFNVLALSSLYSKSCVSGTETFQCQVSGTGLVLSSLHSQCLVSGTGLVLSSLSSQCLASATGLVITKFAKFSVSGFRH